MNQIKNYIKNNKITILLMLGIVFLFTYCGLNTFIINDDLPYSLFERSNIRVTNIIQILRNQASDYLTINGRFLIHCIVQFVLIYGKKLFSILNALVILITLIYITKITKLEKNNKTTNSINILLLALSLFLLLCDYKYLIYWVAGSINYIWLFSILLFLIYNYLNKDLSKNKFLNAFIIIFISSLHECSFVFILFLIIANIIYKILLSKKLNKKEITEYSIYLLLCILGGLIVIKSPGNIIRMNESSNWIKLSFIDKINKSLPIVSKNIFNLTNLSNLIPLIFTLTLILHNSKHNDKKIEIINIILIISTISCIIFSNGYLYFILAIIIFLNLILINIIDKKTKFGLLTIPFFAVPFSMIITPEYQGGRPDYYLYIYMIINICIFISDMINTQKLHKFATIFLILISTSLCLREIKIYNYIGNVHKQRIKEIEQVKKNNDNILKLKIIKEPFAKYHADANEPSNREYWAYKYYCYYYDLPLNVEIELIK